MEMVENLVHLGIETSVVEMGNQVGLLGGRDPSWVCVVLPAAPLASLLYIRPPALFQVMPPFDPEMVEPLHECIRAKGGRRPAAAAAAVAAGSRCAQRHQPCLLLAAASGGLGVPGRSGRCCKHVRVKNAASHAGVHGPPQRSRAPAAGVHLHLGDAVAGFEAAPGGGLHVLTKAGKRHEAQLVMLVGWAPASSAALQRC
jgi:hypothetical protein